MYEGLYLHVPFCVTKCIYCDFNSIAYKIHQVNGYLAALDRDLARISPIQPRTVFLGGGTPTSLSIKQLARFFESFQRSVNLDALEEFTIEANPGTVEANKLEFLRQQGVNRISFGAQSFHPETLKFLGRIHQVEQIHQAVGLAQEAGFENVSIDLIFGVPGQTLDALAMDLQQALSLKTTHLSIYNLIYERGTKLNQLRYQNKVQPVAEELELAMFDLIQETLEQAGFQQYEISNFCRPGYECQHNLIYWQLGTYQAVGPGAHGFDGERRFSLVQDIQKYIDKLKQGESPIVFTEKCTETQKFRETLMMGLRLIRGLTEREFQEKTGFDFSILASTIDFLVQEGLLSYRHVPEKTIALTKQGQKVSDGVIHQLTEISVTPTFSS